MDLFEAISRRRSYRGAFKDSPVPRSDLIRIVRAGMAAPSGVNAQTTDFVIVDDARLITEVARIMGKPLIKTARAIIACTVDSKPTHRGLSFGIEDCAASVENMLLAITALGYASVWIDGNLRYAQRAEKLGALLGVPEPKYIRVVLPVGVPEAQPEPVQKKAFYERAFFNSHGAGTQKSG